MLLEILDVLDVLDIQNMHREGCAEQCIAHFSRCIVFIL